MDFSLASLKKNLQNLEDRFPGKIHERIEGTSENPGWVSRGSSKKIAHSLKYKELRKRNFLQRVRKPLKTEVFRGFLEPVQKLMAYYRCALMEVETKFRVLNEDFSFPHERNPIDSGLVQ